MDKNLVSLTVKEVRKETEEYLSIVFAKPKGFSFDAGESMDVRFPDADFSFFKTYSFASSPTENEVLMSFKKGISSYKKRLELLQPGDTMLMKMYGNMFHFEPKYKSVFFAGGIGIAPFRSVIKFAVDTANELRIKNEELRIGEKAKSKGQIAKDITLLYLNHNSEFAFKEELESWKKILPKLTIHYIVTEKEGRLTKEKVQELVSIDSQIKNYVAGPPKMVDATVEILNDLGVDDKRIKTDSFDGYDEN